MRRSLPVAVLVLVVAASAVWLSLQTAPLKPIVRGGAGPPNIVLLHGYGSNANDWVQFEPVLRLPPNARLLFPNGPWRGPHESRGWWWLNIEGHIPPGGQFPDFSVASPGGIKVASRLVRDFLEDVPGPIVLGGFSQGAMLSGEIAFQTEQPLAALIMIGGTTVNEAGWVERFPGRRNLPILIAHGRQDPVLPFAIAERFAGKLKAAGLDVTWFPYQGGHNIPTSVISELNAFLAKHVSR